MPPAGRQLPRGRSAETASAPDTALVRRARNHKSASKPKNADAMDYKYATALEALIGYWHLTAGAGSAAEDAAAVCGAAARRWL